VFRDFY
jgi:glycogen phosphorylase